MMNKALETIVAVVLTAAAWSCAPALAAGYPDKQITLLVPYPPGGATDFLTRAVAQKMSESMGQPIIVENRGGASGTIGSNIVARAAADGYTILMGTNASHALSRFTLKSVPYDAVKDFTPITEAVQMPVVLAVHTSVPANNVKEFVEYVKKNPGKISFGTPGMGGGHYLAGELLKQMTGIDMLHVPYKGTGPSMQDLLGGQIPAIFGSLAATLPQMRAGKIKILGLIEAKRQPSAPDIPTIGESIPGYVMPSAWNGFFGPAGLPVPIVKRLNTEMVKALHAPDMRAKLETAGLAVTGTSAEEFATVLRTDIDLYRKITAAIGIKPQ